MNGFEKRRQEKKRTIIEAALELFKQDGIDAVRVTDIAKRAGVSKVSIYNYFGGKEELARQVLCDLLDSGLTDFEKFLECDLSFKEKFEMLYEAKKEAAEVDESFYKILSSPKMQHFIATYYEAKSKPLMIEFIEQGKREGYIDQDLSNEALLIYYESSKSIASVSLDKMLRSELIRLYFYGFRGK